MGEVAEFRVDNGTPNKHCGKAEPHERHSRTIRDGGTIVSVWCDGIPPLEPFVELTVRASLSELFGEVAVSHAQALHLVAKYGIGMLLDCIGKPETAMVLRVRSGDGQDRMYPLVKRNEGKGFAAVTDVEVRDVSRN